MFFKTAWFIDHGMNESDGEIQLTVDQLKDLCLELGLKKSKKYRILVSKLVKKVGSTDLKKLRVALDKAMIAS